MLVKLEMHVDPDKVREMIRYALPFGDEAVRHTRTQFDDRAMRGLRAIVNSDEIWDWFQRDVWPVGDDYDEELLETVSAAEAEETEGETEGEKPSWAYVPGEAAVLEYARASATNALLVQAAERSGEEPEQFVEYLPLILTLAKILLAWSKRNR